jgi:hypothetical protein
MAERDQQEKNPEETKVDNDELTPADLDDIAGGAKPAFINDPNRQ